MYAGDLEESAPPLVYQIARAGSRVDAFLSLAVPFSSVHYPLHVLPSVYVQVQIKTIFSSSAFVPTLLCLPVLGPLVRCRWCYMCVRHACTLGLFATGHHAWRGSLAREVGSRYTNI